LHNEAFINYAEVIFMLILSEETVTVFPKVGKTIYKVYDPSFHLSILDAYEITLDTHICRSESLTREKRLNCHRHENEKVDKRGKCL
jgi:hypothetical protein